MLGKFARIAVPVPGRRWIATDWGCVLFPKAFPGIPRGCKYNPIWQQPFLVFNLAFIHAVQAASNSHFSISPLVDPVHNAVALPLQISCGARVVMSVPFTI